MPSPSKTKGNHNETVVAEILTKWWGSPFKRMPTSGALRWKGAAFTYGDLITPEDFPFIVECKHYAKVDVDELLRKDWDQGLITWWWQQVLDDCKRYNTDTGKTLQPMLVWKANNRPHRICVLRRILSSFMPVKRLRTIEFYEPGKEAWVMSMFDLQEFLAEYTKEDILAANLSS